MGSPRADDDEYDWIRSSHIQPATSHFSTASTYQQDVDIAKLRIVNEQRFNELRALVNSSADKAFLNPSELEVVRLIASGAYGDVFEGRWRGYPVAIKRPKAATSAKYFEFFKREVVVMKSIVHLNIVQFIGMSEEPFQIVMELMPRGSVSDLMHSCAPQLRFTTSMFIATAESVATAMNYLDSNNIVHRDLTPMNLLVDNDMHVKVADFGQSRTIARDMTYEGITNCRWRAPEIAQRQPYTSKVDIYAFGLVLYELLTGNLPFDDLDGPSAMRKLQEGQRPQFPSWADYPQEITTLIEKCWSDDPTKRPTWSEIIKMIQQMSLSIGRANRLRLSSSK